MTIISFFSLAKNTISFAARENMWQVTTFEMEEKNLPSSLITDYINFLYTFWCWPSKSKSVGRWGTNQSERNIFFVQTKPQKAKQLRTIQCRSSRVSANTEYPIWFRARIVTIIIAHTIRLYAHICVYSRKYVIREYHLIHINYTANVKKKYSNTFLKVFTAHNLSKSFLSDEYTIYNIHSCMYNVYCTCHSNIPFRNTVYTMLMHW